MRSIFFDVIFGNLVSQIQTSDRGQISFPSPEI